LKDHFDLAQEVAEAFRKNRQEALAGLDEWIVWWRDVMMLQAESPGSVVNTDRVSELQGDASTYEPLEVRAFVASLMQTSEYLTRNVQARMAMEALMLHAPARLQKTRINQ
jgi:hypothetical protein